jgi:prepilin-type N-terminal cleavage/methylation domain-containing protein
MNSQMSRLREGHEGFTLLEILVAMMILAFFIGTAVIIQQNTMSRTRSSNKMLVAGHLIEKQIEYMRMQLLKDPDNNWPPGDTTFTSNDITLNCVVSDAYDLETGSTTKIDSVRKLDIEATWVTDRPDTLRVETYLAKMF